MTDTPKDTLPKELAEIEEDAMRVQLARLTDAKNFGGVLEAYRVAALDAAEKRAAADSAYRIGMLTSNGKNEGVRTADAESAAADAELIAKKAEVEKQCLRHLLIHLRADGGRAERDEL